MCNNAIACDFAVYVIKMIVISYVKSYFESHQFLFGHH